MAYQPLFNIQKQFSNKQLQETLMNIFQQVSDSDTEDEYVVTIQISTWVGSKPLTTDNIDGE